MLYFELLLQVVIIKIVLEFKLSTLQRDLVLFRSLILRLFLKLFLHVVESKVEPIIAFRAFHDLTDALLVIVLTIFVESLFLSFALTEDLASLPRDFSGNDCHFLLKHLLFLLLLLIMQFLGYDLVSSGVCAKTNDTRFILEFAFIDIDWLGLG
jgi:hypothetical protein